jgi:hypothetical protein
MYLHINFSNKFLLNKYTKWYFNIILEAQSRSPLPRGETEHHHVLPKSLWPEYQKLSIHDWNGAHITHKEHFICHWLLTKMVSGTDKIPIYHAFHWMSVSSPTHSRRYTSKQYSIAKQYLSLARKERLKDKTNPFISRKGPSNHNWGRKHSAETKMLQRISKLGDGNPAKRDDVRKKISDSLLSHYKTHENPFKHKTHSDETKQLMRDQIDPDRFTGDKNPMANLETRRKVGDTRRGKCWITNDITNQLVSKSTALPDGWRKGFTKRK